MKRASPIKVPKSSFKPNAFDEADEHEIAALRGFVVKYVDPYEPVGSEDWEAAR